MCVCVIQEARYSGVKQETKGHVLNQCRSACWLSLFENRAINQQSPSNWHKRDNTCAPVVTLTSQVWEGHFTCKNIYIPLHFLDFYMQKSILFCPKQEHMLKAKLTELMAPSKAILLLHSSAFLDFTCKIHIIFCIHDTYTTKFDMLKQNFI